MAKKEMDDDEISSGNGDYSPLAITAAFEPDDKAYASNNMTRQPPRNNDINPERTFGSSKRNPTDIGS